MTSTGLQTLLKDHEAERMRERRREPRRAFSRPVRMAFGPNRREFFNAFSRDISNNGIGVVGQMELEPMSIGWLSVNLLNSKTLTIRARVQWCEPFGDGWYLAGWEFLD